MLALIIKTSSMGDIIHTLPALTDAANLLKNISFDWVVEEDFYEIPSWHFAVRKVIKVAIRRWRKNIFKFNSLREYLKFIKILREEYYDYIIDAQGLIKSSLLITYFARGKKFGFNSKSSRESLSSMFYHNTYFINKHQHAIDRIRKLFSYSLKYIFNKKKLDYGIRDNFIYKLTSSKKNYIIFIYASTKKNKKWPESYWRSLTKFIIRNGYDIKLFCKENYDYLFAKSLEEEFTNVKVFSSLTLTEIAYHLIQARATISIDTGLSHLSASFNIPNLTLYGPTDPKIIGCNGLNQYFINSYDNNMRNIKPEQVLYYLNCILKKTKLHYYNL